MFQTTTTTTTTPRNRSKEGESHYNISWPRICCVAQAGPELSAIFLLQSSNCWDYEYEVPHQPSTPHPPPRTVKIQGWGDHLVGKMVDHQTWEPEFCSSELAGQSNVSSGFSETLSQKTKWKAKEKDSWHLWPLHAYATCTHHTHTSNNSEGNILFYVALQWQGIM